MNEWGGGAGPAGVGVEKHDKNILYEREVFNKKGITERTFQRQEAASTEALR